MTGLAVALALTLVSLGMLIMAKPAQAKTFTVDFTPDQSDFNPGDGTCDISSTILSFCSLRAAIQEANDTAAPDIINFDIPGGGVQTIKPTSELPPITAPVTINGYTQQGASPNTIAQGATNATLLIQLDGSGAGGFATGLIVSAPNCVVKGLVINRFGEDGIRLAYSDRVEGNFIGTDPTGTIDMGNDDEGVSVAGANDTVGGATPAARNLISGNDDNGILIDNVSNDKIQGNLIGTDKNGTADLGNSGSGVRFYDVALPASNTTIGGSAPARNTIAFNGEDGVGLFSRPRNYVLFNSIFSNDGLGIDIFGDGPTPNSPNSLVNKPVITTAKATTKKKKKLTSISGTLNSAPNKNFTIQIFSNPSGTDEGKTFLGQRSVKTNQNGNASFGIGVPRTKAPVGSAITATSTNPTENTSEFSAPRAVK